MIDTLASPIIEALPLRSPASVIVLAVAHFDDVDALPVTSPVTLPVSAAVIVPAAKFPEPSRFTSVDAVFTLVPALASETALLISVCVPVTAPVKAGKVSFIVLFKRRMWLSPSPMLSELVGLDATNPLM